MVKLLLSTGSKRDDLAEVSRIQPNITERQLAWERLRKKESRDTYGRMIVCAYSIVSFLYRKINRDRFLTSWFVSIENTKFVSSWINQEHIEHRGCRFQSGISDTWAFTFLTFYENAALCSCCQFTFSRRSHWGWVSYWIDLIGRGYPHVRMSCSRLVRFCHIRYLRNEIICWFG